MLKWFCVLFLMQCLMDLTSAHGRLMDPPSRMSAWRVGFKVPVNYDDQGMNCGTVGTQWGKNGGKCGICGEPWSGPRNYERPHGTMVQHNIITRKYEENSLINVTIQLTANHKGWSEFRICDIATSGGIEATQACLNKNLLADKTGNTQFNIPPEKIGFLHYSLVLPKGMTCDHCMVQWKWKTGSSWGCDDLGCGLGRGDGHEEFYGCSDVSVVRKGLTTSAPSSHRISPSFLSRLSTTRRSTAGVRGYDVLEQQL